MSKEPPHHLETNPPRTDCWVDRSPASTLKPTGAGARPPPSPHAPLPLTMLTKPQSKHKNKVKVRHWTRRGVGSLLTHMGSKSPGGQSRERGERWTDVRRCDRLPVYLRPEGPRSRATRSQEHKAVPHRHGLHWQPAGFHCQTSSPVPYTQRDTRVGSQTRMPHTRRCFHFNHFITRTHLLIKRIGGGRGGSRWAPTILSPTPGLGALPLRVSRAVSFPPQRVGSPGAHGQGLCFRWPSSCGMVGHPEGQRGDSPPFTCLDSRPETDCSSHSWSTRPSPAPGPKPPTTDGPMGEPALRL